MLKVGSCGVDLTLIQKNIRLLKRCFDGSSLFPSWERAPSPQSSPARHLVAMARNLTRVILNEVKNLDLSIGSKKRDPSVAPQDDTTPQSFKKKEEGKRFMNCFMSPGRPAASDCLNEGTKNVGLRLNLANKLFVICLISYLIHGCAGRQAVIAVSGTVIGVEISQNPANQSPQAKLGYNRGEIAIVPTNRSATEEAGTSPGGAKDIADVIMEIRYGGIFDSGPSSGIYQRLAVGPTAVIQPGASVMFARDANGEISPQAADVLKSLKTIPTADPEISKMKISLANVFRTSNDAAQKQFHAAAKAAGFDDFNAFLLNKPREPSVSEIKSIREGLEAQGFKF
jgi:hypothetical protein